ncbi:DUF6858 family protein [Magnetospirillum sp. UT-4]|uniref:DUF6858 family protein n=1 Tax=Magnetospirillum sp. UT-4 TaxID=2681467 RepID=UPI001385F783|nr:hypothetical protein [Magnetospirillum sp. UT-4]CAA7626293.1 conserved hypothetical protein [Magnetospirillum sp. UT-4]
MKQSVFMEKYPVFSLELAKDETSMASVDDIVAYFRARIEGHGKATFIAVFDHFGHTKRLGGEIDPAIKDAKNVVFCFGLALPNPQVMAVRPRSIGIVDLGDRFFVNFMEAPMKAANDAMEEWAKGLRDRG